MNEIDWKRRYHVFRRAFKMFVNVSWFLLLFAFLLIENVPLRIMSVSVWLFLTAVIASMGVDQ